MPPIELLNHAAEQLGDLCQEVVFLGGAVVGLLLTEKVGCRPELPKTSTWRSKLARAS